MHTQAKIAKLKRELLEPASGGGGGGGERGFEVHKVGDARVGFVGVQHLLYPILRNKTPRVVAIDAFCCFSRAVLIL